MFKDLFSMRKKERYTNCTTIYQGVPDHTETVPEAVTVRRWYEKQAENSHTERWGPEKVIVFALLAVVAIFAAYAARDAAGIAICFLLLTAYSIAADPLHLLRRKVSRSSRVIMAGAALPIVVIIAIPTLRTVMVAVVVILTASIIAIKGNGHWRAAESYRMSRHVLKALQPDDNTDKRDACLLSWQADGAREVVAAAAEMGAYSCQEIEWQVRKAAYTIGFCRASTITRQHERDRTAAIREAQAARMEAETIRQRMEEVTAYAGQLDEYREKLDAADRLAAEGAAAISELMKAQDENRKLKAKIKQLEEANETLLNTAANPLIAAEAAEQLTRQRLEEAAQKGYSVSQTEAYAGVSHRRAQYFLKEWRETHGKGKPDQKAG